MINQFFSGTFAGFIIALVPIIIFTRTQIRIAKEDAGNKLKLQEQRILCDRLKDETKLEREKLEELHKILSKISLENSLTMSYIQSDSNLEISEFRNRYLDNCAQLSNARAIVALYFPDMSDEVEQIYGQSNHFWGYQENVLNTDIKTSREQYQSNLDKVVSAANEISKLVHSVKNKMTYQAALLKKNHPG